MHKVIVEEPRGGGGYSKQRRRGSLPYDLLPRHEGIRRPYFNRKWFGEHLGPLKRWLRSNVGRRWDDIYSEACRVIKPNDVVRLHIRTHMMQYVERNTFMRCGEVWYLSGWGEAPVSSIRSSTPWPRFYVHPETGVLHEAQQSKRKRRHWPRSDSETGLAEKRINKNLMLMKIEGFWFACELRPYSEAPEIPPLDCVVKMRVSEPHAYQMYGRSVYCVRKQQLSRRELKKHGLTNSSSPRGVFDFVGADLLRRIKASNGNSVRGRFQSNVRCFDTGLRHFKLNEVFIYDRSMKMGYRLKTMGRAFDSRVWLLMPG